MKTRGLGRFFRNVALFAAIAGVISLALLWKGAGGPVDTFYAKFTRQASALIVGSSRAAQGLDPAIVGAGISVAGDWLNFAFTNANSPYGPVYLRAMQRKLPRDLTGGVFVVEVNPLMVSIGEREREDVATFRERDLTLDRQTIFNAEPNFDYLLRNFRQPLYTLLFPGHRPASQILHANGWLELRVPMDAASLADRKARGLASYANVFRTDQLSPLRSEFLGRTVAMLRTHGRVILLRMPTSPEMAALEQNYAPRFDEMMTQIAARHGAEYVNWIGESARFETIDGNHLSLDSARRCSGDLNALLRRLSAVPKTP